MAILALKPRWLPLKGDDNLIPTWCSEKDHVLKVPKVTSQSLLTGTIAFVCLICGIAMRQRGEPGASTLWAAACCTEVALSPQG